MKPYVAIGAVFATLACFWFPWPLAFLLAVAVSLFVPPFAFVIGALLEFLYSAGEFPTFLVAGFIAALIAQFVHQWLKTRIMS